MCSCLCVCVLEHFVSNKTLRFNNFHLCWLLIVLLVWLSCASPLVYNFSADANNHSHINPIIPTIFTVDRSVGIAHNIRTDAFSTDLLWTHGNMKFLGRDIIEWERSIKWEQGEIDAMEQRQREGKREPLSEHGEYFTERENNHWDESVSVEISKQTWLSRVSCYSVCFARFQCTRKIGTVTKLKTVDYVFSLVCSKFKWKTVFIHCLVREQNGS